MVLGCLPSTHNIITLPPQLSLMLMHLSLMLLQLLSPLLQLLLLPLQSMLDKVDKLIIGGGMVFTFLKARGLSVGTSLVEEDQIDLAKKVTMHCLIICDAPTTVIRQASNSIIYA
jgi:Phosphoglycerate kinase